MIGLNLYIFLTDNTVWLSNSAAHCCYNNSLSNKDIYGAFYNANLAD